jgi:hypothetical protein
MRRFAAAMVVVLLFPAAAAWPGETVDSHAKVDLPGGGRLSPQGEALQRDMERRKKSVPVEVGALLVRAEGGDGLSVSFELHEAGGRPVAADGEATVIVFRIDAGRKVPLGQLEYRIVRADFRATGQGADSPPGDRPTYRTGKIPYRGFQAPPPREAGAKGFLELTFRCDDGTVLVGSAEFAFGGRPSAGLR